MSQLDQLLGYLEREGVSEVIVGVGRPIAMRNATGLTNVTARPVSSEQLTNMLRGSPIAALIPDTDSTPPPEDVQIGTRKVRVHVGRRGDEILVRLSRIEGVAPQRTVATQPVPRVAEAPAKEPETKTPAATATTRAKTPTSSQRTKAPTGAKSAGGRTKPPTRSGAKRGLDFDPNSIDLDSERPPPFAEVDVNLDTQRPTSFKDVDVNLDTQRPQPFGDVDINLDSQRPQKGIQGANIQSKTSLGLPIQNAKSPATGPIPVTVPASSSTTTGAVAGRGEFQRSSDLQRDGGFQRAGAQAPSKPDNDARSPNDARFANDPRHDQVKREAVAHAAPVPAPNKKTAAAPGPSNVTFASKPKPPPAVTDYIRLPTAPIPTTPADPELAADGLGFDAFSLDDGLELGAAVKAHDDDLELGAPVKAHEDDDFELPRQSTDDFEPDVPSLSPSFELMAEDVSAARLPVRARSAGVVRPDDVERDATQPLGRAPTQQAPSSALQAKTMAATARVSGGFEKLVMAARERGASDLHISAARVTSIRVGSELVPLDPNGKPLSPSDAEALLRPLIDASSQDQFELLGYVDFALEAPGGGRLRANICRQQAGMKGTFRLAMPAPLPLDQLGLPAELAKVVAHHQGFVVIAGPSGHGKTTTLASLVDLVNSTKPHHILTIEDPIELVHPRKQAVVSQREVGRHTVSFARGLKASLREDPDVIVIGELRDRESVEIALTAAETGHLVLATMSTPSATKTIDRLVDMFPPEEHSQVRASVAGALRAIVAQRLVPRRGGKGVVPAIELVTGVLPLAVMIREDKMYQLPNLMQRGRAFGMIRFDESLAEHVRAGRIDEETALAFAESKKDLAASLQSKTQLMWKDPSRR